ncbi:MAG: recombinase family protein [Acidobacteria bacterium]|nr:recombinase family protein [Acidobacteriota bacterium]
MSTLLVRAAQYLRMSTEDQQYSIANQSLRIGEYAQKHGFSVTKTYTDPGKSGVLIKRRDGLNALLKDVVNGAADFKAILVYDVSRWGRFQNPDEAAHYEFLCSRSGIPLHYCAEQFSNDGSASSAIVKALKRSMAAEFSRELGEKVVLGKVRLAQMGFWMGGPPGYAYRRRMVSIDGKLKQVLKNGQQKSLKTDRITLVLGPSDEIKLVRMIFSMASRGSNCTDIVRELSRKHILFDGRSWNDVTVLSILTNPKYTGCNVWNRRTQRLHSALKQVDPRLWITKPLAFPAIVDRRTFERAQITIQKMRDSRWPDEKILKRIRRLLKSKGTLSETLILKARGMPSTQTIHKHFGTYRQLYEKLGYELDARYVFKSDQQQRTKKLRYSLINDLKTQFPDHVAVALSWKGGRSVLRIDNGFMVSIVFCRPERTQKGLCWAVKAPEAERDYITLLCLLNRRHDRVLRYHLVPRLGSWKTLRMYGSTPFLRQATKLGHLSDFYTAVARLRDEKQAARITTRLGTGLL